MDDDEFRARPDRAPAGHARRRDRPHLGGLLRRQLSDLPRAADLPQSPRDTRLGELAGATVAIDADQDRRWLHPSFYIDVEAGAAGGFSLEALEDLRFTVDSRA